MDNPETEDDDKKYFRIGAALDCLLTSRERWEEDFEVVDVSRPFGLMGKFIDNLPKNLNILSSEKAYQEAWDKSGYKMRLNKIIEKFWENEEFVKYYMLTRSINDNKIILSKDEFESVTKAKDLIIANPFVHKYFFSTNPNVEILHQVDIYFKYLDEDCKALLDGILINHVERTIEPFDLKTTGKSVYDFPISFMQYGYYRQCAFYELALSQEGSPVKKYIDDGYKVLDFSFIVTETKATASHPAIIFVTNAEDRACGLNGGVVGKKKYKGIIQLIEEYKYYKESNNWDMPKDLIDSEGRIYLNIFNDTEESVIYTSDDDV